MNSLRSECKGLNSIILGVIPIVILFLVWWYLTKGVMPEDRIISPVTLPNPFEVIDKIPALITTGKLLQGIRASFERVIFGFLVAIIFALPLGIAMGSFGKIKTMFNPITVMLSYLPISALVPLSLVWFGTGEIQKIMFLAIAFFVYILPMIVKSLDKVDEIYIQTGYTLGANTFQIVKKILIPIAFYDIWQAMRLAMGIGWSYIILAEVIFSDAGLGQIITVAQRRGPKEFIYLVIVVIALLAWSTDKIWDLVGKKIFPYKKR